MFALLAKLSLTELVAENNAERAFGTSPTTVTMAAGLVNAMEGMDWRFVRIQAHDGDLLIEIGDANNANRRAGAPNSGSRRVRNGTETFQLPAGTSRPEIQIAAVTGTVHGAVLWGR